jgi:predicted transposase/invertase (TIGR01784 family)
VAIYISEGGRMESRKKLTLLNDTLGKAFLLDKRNKWLVAKLISLVTETKYEDVFETMSFRETELYSDTRGKKSIGDLVLDIGNNDLIVNIELNSEKTLELICKNLYYISALRYKSIKAGEQYKTGPKLVQINIDNYQRFKNEARLVYECLFMEKHTHEVDDLKETRYYLNLNYLKNMNQEDIEKNELAKILYLFKEDNVEELNKMYKNDKEFKKALKVLDELKDDPSVMLYYDSDALQKNIQAELIENATKEASTKGLAKGLKKGLAKGLAKGLEKGLEKGKSQSQRETALNMLKLNLDDDIIMKSTGITKSKLDELKKE